MKITDIEKQRQAMDKEWELPEAEEKAFCKEAAKHLLELCQTKTNKRLKSKILTWDWDIRIQEVRPLINRDVILSDILNNRAAVINTLPEYLEAAKEFGRWLEKRDKEVYIKIYQKRIITYTDV